MKTVPGLSSWELDNWLITTFLKQNLIVKTSNTLHQPSSRGHWCPLPRWAKNSALGSHHTNSKSKTGIRTALTWMQEEQQRLGRPKTKLKRKQRKRKNEVDCLKWRMHDRCHQSWLWSETELEFGLFLKREEKQRTHKKPWSKARTKIQI